MKKIISVTIFTFCVLLVWGQDGLRKERIDAFRTKFYTQQLELTTEESQQFWPIYNEIEKEKKALKKEYKADGKIELMSDAELENFISNHLVLEEKQLALKRKYYNQVKEILPIRKVAILSRVEQRFKRKLLEEVRKRREGRRGGGSQN
ncbi:MAG: hypothetical protein NXI23_24210 [Bacteroidetes bacterium]|jgi:hypothetical protein|nr:hypothetical protein [Bacteroidota bacterium]MDF1864980.1 hypothetical protein [Saprospiraceae bacterium]